MSRLRMGGRRRRRTVAAVLSLLALLLVTNPAGATVPAGPVGASQTQTWHVSTPACSMTQAWSKSPGALTTNAISFTGSVRCLSIPPNLVVQASIQVYDVGEPRKALNGPAAVEASGGMTPSTTPESIDLDPVLYAPKAGHSYAFEFFVSFVDEYNFTVEGVSGAPPQCMEHNDSTPFADGPPGWIPPSVDCSFVEAVSVL